MISCSFVIDDYINSLNPFNSIFFQLPYVGNIHDKVQGLKELNVFPRHLDAVPLEDMRLLCYV